MVPGEETTGEPREGLSSPKERPLRPLGKRVLFEPVDWNRVWQADSGVWASEKGTPITQGRVVAIGPAVSLDIHEGDYIVFMPNQYQSISPNRWLVHEDVCLATLEEDGASDDSVQGAEPS